MRKLGGRKKEINIYCELAMLPIELYGGDFVFLAVDFSNPLPIFLGRGYLEKTLGEGDLKCY